MKNELVEYMARCGIYQQVNMEHQKLIGLLQPLLIPEWKWKNITMDFVSGLPMGKRASMRFGHHRPTNQICTFLPMKMVDLVEKLAKLYMNEVVRLHGVPVLIVSDRDPRFTSWLWAIAQQALRTKLNLSTTFHTQTVVNLREPFKYQKTCQGLYIGVQKELARSYVVSRVYL